MAEVSRLPLLGADDDSGRRDFDEDVIALDSSPYWSSDFEIEEAFASVSEFPPPDLHHPHHIDRMAEVDVVSDPDSIVTVDHFDCGIRASLIMDLLEQRFEQSSVGDDDDIVSVSPDPSSGVIEWNDEIGSSQFRMDLGLGLGFRIDRHGLDERNDDGDHRNSGFMVVDCGDEFYVSRRESISGNGGDSRPDENEVLVETDMNEMGEDLDWEEVNASAYERGLPSLFVDVDMDEDLNSPVSTPVPSSEVMIVDGVSSTATRNLDWEILLYLRDLEEERELEELLMREFELHQSEDALEHEMMAFGQFADGEAAIVGKPPASRTVIENLHTVVLSQEDVDDGNAVCAVCKDGMDVGEEAKELPCSHRYHEECIVPWLGIRNTCPVCRFELATDDLNYERLRAQRSDLVQS